MSTPTEAKFSLTYYTGFLSVLFAAFLWGTAGTAASFAKGISPLVIATISVGFGGLIHTFLSLKAIKKDYRKLFDYKTKVLIAVIVSILCPFAFYSSVSLAGVSIGTVISIGCAPLFSVMLEWLLDKRKLSLKWLISFILGFLGVVLLSYAGEHSHQHQGVQSERLLGVFFGLLSSLSYATYSWIMKNLIHKGINSRAAMGVIFGISAVLLLPTLLITATHLFNYPNNIWVALYIPIVPIFLGYLFFSFG
ncbi:eamA-like transporter family protein [Acinetobacter baumannii 25766_5]|nr:eamA-like transporter family protein [Acinetobacter baumannii 25766_5]